MTFLTDIFVLLHWGYYNKNTTHWVTNNKQLSVIVWEGGEFQIRMLAALVTGEGHFVVIVGHLLTVSSHGRDEGDLRGNSFIGALSSFMKILLL